MIDSVGGVPIHATHRASCHCGTVVLELDLPDGIVRPLRCNCSMCRRRGAIMGAVPRGGLRVVQGESALKTYRFHTEVACHYFCSNCGIYTHHQRRSNPEEFGYNLGCLDGVDPYALDPVPVTDGANHPLDRRG